MFRLKLIKKPILLKLKTNFSFPPIVLANMQEKEVIPTKEQQEIVPDKNYDGLSKVIVDKIPDEYIIPTGNIEIIENGIYNVREKESATVNIPEPKLGTKNITSNGVYKASNDGLDGYSEVDVNVTGSDNGFITFSNFTDNGYPQNATVNKIGGKTKVVGNLLYCPQSVINSNGDNHFYTYISNINVADGFTEIGNNCFRSLISLKLMELPNSITKIDDYSFYEDKLLEITELPDSITTIGRSAFQSCTNLALTKLPDSLSTIENSCFQNCTKLALTKLPNALKKIRGTYIFSNCTNLTEIEMPQNIIVLTSAQTFLKCTNLKKIKFNQVDRYSNSYIGSQFAYSTNLSVLLLDKLDFVLTLYSANAFANTPIALGTGYTYVADNMVDVYKAATNWSTYADQIKPISEYVEEVI